MTRGRSKGRWQFRWYHADGTPDGRPWEFPNGTTAAGVAYLTDVALAAGSQIATWYAGLISGATTPTLDPDDTMSSHAGWTEFTAYDEAARRTWTPASAGGVATGTVAFTMTTAGTIAGAFLTSVSTKGGSTGTLFATAVSGSSQVKSAGQTLRARYVFSQTGS
jgi:hypothetical protein